VDVLGFSSTPSAHLLLVNRVGDDEAWLFAPAAAVTFHFRGADEPLWLRALDPGIGIDAIALPFDNAAHLGGGLHLSLFDNWLSAGGGIDFQAKEHRGFWFVGLDLLKAVR
jgi:hypothetical protein